MTSRCLFLSLSTLLLCSGCIQVGGTWTGTVKDSTLSSSGRLHVDIAQSLLFVNGTWSADFPGSANDNSGILSGTMLGSQATLRLIPSRTDACPFQVTGTFDDMSFDGTFAAFSCPYTQSGTVTLTKQ